MASYLWVWKADLEIADRAGRTAVTRAGQLGRDQVVTILLRGGATCQNIDPGWKAKCDRRKAELGK